MQIKNKQKRKYSRYGGQIPVQVKAAFWFLMSTPVFTRLLTASEYGQYNVFNSWLGITTIFVSLYLYSGMYHQGLVKFEEERSIYASSLQGLTVILCTIWTVIYLLFHDFWNGLMGLTTVQVLAMLVMIWTTSVFNFWAGRQRVEYRYKALVLITLLVSMAKPGLGILLVLHAKDKVTARILGLVLVELAGYTWMFVYQMYSGKVFFSKKFWKYALRLNLPLLPHYLSQTVLSSADRIMIKQLVGAAEAGIYGLAYNISLLMTLFNTALQQTLSPWIYQKIKEKNMNKMADITFIAFVFTAVMNLGLIAFAPEIVRIFAPAEYYPAIYVIPPIAMSVLCMFAYNIFSTFEFYYEKSTFIMTASIIGAILNVVLNRIFIPKFGYYAAGYTTLICYLIYVGCHYYCMQKLCKENLDGVQIYETKKLLILMAVFMLSGFMLLVTYSYPVIRYILAASGLGLVLLNKKKIISSLKLLADAKKGAK